MTVTGEESTVTVPLVEPKEEKALSMRSFVILGITAAVFDVFYAPCTAMGNSGDIPLSPYVWIIIIEYHKIGYFWDC